MLLAQQTAVDGFVAGASPTATRPNCLTDGSENLLLVGNGRLTAHSGILEVASKLGSRTLFQISDGGYAGLGNAATNGIGSIVNLIARAFAFIGQGLLVINGVSRAVNASTALQILLYKSGGYTASGTGPFTAGIEQMEAPTIAEHSANASTKNSGTVSVVTGFVRSATGGRGRKSSPSEVVVVDGKTLRVTISSSDLTLASAMGYDRIYVAVPQWGFGASGPHYILREVAISSLTTVDGVANSLELEWSSAELNGADLAPLDDFPPPAAVFAAALEDVAAVVGAYGDIASGVSATSPGTAVVVSLPVYIESFPPDNLLFLPGAPVGVLPTPSGGFAFVAGLNYMCALTYTGGSPALSLQTLWATTGIANPNAMFLGMGGRLCCFSNGRRGLVRMNEEGQPETAWAADASDYVSAWDPAKVVGGWDNDYQFEVYCHERTILLYNAQLERFCAPVSVAGALSSTEEICAAVTVGGSLYFATRDTANTAAAMKVWTLHGGTGTTWSAYFNWNRSAQIADDLFLVEVAVRSDNTTWPVTVEIFQGGDDDTAVRSKEYTLTETGLQHLSPWEPNLVAAKSYKVKVSGRSAGGDAGPEAVRLSGEPCEIVF
jgi:hypothetical protein